MPRKGGKALKSTIIELLGVTVDGKEAWKQLAEADLDLSVTVFSTLQWK